LRGTALALAAVALLGAGLGAGCGGDGGNDDEPPMAWSDAPVVPRLTGETRTQFLADVAAADARGRNPDVFAKVGDSNTEQPQNLYGFGCRPVEYGRYGALAPVVERYKATPLPGATPPGCGPSNSFTRLSVSARSGSQTMFPVTRIGDDLRTAGRAVTACSREEAPVDCEIRVINPRYTIVLTGSNDILLDARWLGIEPGSEANERTAAIVERIRRDGSVPVLSNLPPAWIPGSTDVDEWGGVLESNANIQAMADELNVPLINLWRGLEEAPVVNRGLADDGIHLSAYPNGGSTDVFANTVVLTEAGLRYGANRRNLIWLQTLAALDRVAAGG